MKRVQEEDSRLDPLLASSFRELKWILSAWGVMFFWVVLYCGRYGYHLQPEQLETTFGMPSWVFWGVLVPWLSVTVFTLWFALLRMDDNSLDGAPAPHEEEEHDG